MPEQTREPSIVDTAISIADTLGEQEQAVRRQIQDIVWALGRTQARALLQETLDIEQSGGMMLPDLSRRRTPGGVFFHLVYSKGQAKEGRTLKRPYRKPVQSPVPTVTTQTTETSVAPVITFTWADRIAVIQEAQTKRGAANVKITLIGRPGKIVDRGQCVVIVMESTKVPALPKGVPTPPAAPTKYTVYIGAKQWKKVAEAVNDPEDVLIIEGYPQIDKESGSISVFATNVTSKKLQAAKRTISL